MTPTKYLMEQKVCQLSELSELQRKHPEDAKRLKEMAAEEMTHLGIPVETK